MSAPGSNPIPPKASGGVVEWMTRNSVAANLFMFALLGGGLFSALSIKQEVFPSFQLDIVDISISYPGASPEEVEEGIILAVEEELRGLTEVERVVSTAEEGSAQIQVELTEGVDPNRALQEVKNAVDRVSSLPEEAERPNVELQEEQESVFWLIVHGPFDEQQIFDLAERIRRDLIALPEVTQVEVNTQRDPEITIEIPQARLRALGLTLTDVAQIIEQSAQDTPAGGIRTEAGEVLLRTRERRDFASEYGNIILVSTADGADVRVADIAKITDGFEDRLSQNLFNGGHGIFVSIFESGQEKPLDIADAVNKYLEEIKDELPEGAGVHVMRDRAEQYRERLQLLMTNGLMGFALVLLVLGCFLAPRLAFWVAFGIPTTIAGSLLLLPALDASINMISLFAYIITLGIVVDDAVIIGDNVFYRIQQGMPRLQAAIEGSREMVVPVIFSIGTNIIAFVPLMFVPGETGRFFAPLPAVVIAVFVVSLLEALFILPAHLGHGRESATGRGPIAALTRFQRRISESFDRLTDSTIVPIVRFCVHHRLLTISLLFGSLSLMYVWYYSGRMNYTFNPVITSLRVDAEAQTPIGSAFADTVAIANHIEEAGLRAADKLGGRDKVVNGRMNVVGRRGENWADVNFYLIPADERDFTEDTFAKLWREEIGEVPGLKSLFFEWEEGPGSGAGLTVELSHPDRDVLEAAATELAQQLATFNGVSDIKDGFSAGKTQISVDLTEEGKSLGLTPELVGRQVRHAFYGAEALRFQRGRHEVKVMVRLPQAERQSLNNVEGLIIRTPNGGEAPLSQVAKLNFGTAYTEIIRVDGQRVLEVTCNVIPEIASSNEIRAALRESVLPQLADEFRGLSFEFSGRQREEDRAMNRLKLGLGVALAIIFGLLAALFRSYTRALFVMLIIPFAVGAALLGHVILGYDLSIVSVFGMIALSGLVVNGGLVLNQEIDRLIQEENMHIQDAVVAAARRRFRPILLTSLTTFAGLAPMILETSSQARFLVPMAIALGFGTILSAPVVILLPACLSTLGSGPTRDHALAPVRKAEPPAEPAFGK
ncbi:MAG: multidrug transporter AcrB [Candidatus Hydrogenedentota bacterium]